MAVGRLSKAALLEFSTSFEPDWNQSGHSLSYAANCFNPTWQVSPTDYHSVLVIPLKKKKRAQMEDCYPQADGLRQTSAAVPRLSVL